MPENGTYTAVLDRFEDTQAVLVLQDEGEDIAEYLIEQAALPEGTRHQDAIFEVRLKDDEIDDVSYDAAETETRKEQAQSRFDRLSKRPPTSESDKTSDTDSH